MDYLIERRRAQLRQEADWKVQDPDVGMGDIGAKAADMSLSDRFNETVQRSQTNQSLQTLSKLEERIDAHKADGDAFREEVRAEVATLRSKIEEILVVLNGGAAALNPDTPDTLNTSATHSTPLNQPS